MFDRPIKSVAVVGAGMAGITCALTLSLQLKDVKVFELGHHAGGRMASTRVGGYEFDLGAQYFTAQDEVFRGYVETWQSEGLVQPWSGWIVDLDGGNMIGRGLNEGWYVGVPNMAALVRYLARLCHVQYGCQVGRVHPMDGAWQLLGANAEDLGTFDLVIMAVPPTQAAELLAEVTTSIHDKMADVQMACAWVVGMGYERSIDAPFAAAYMSDPILNWIARNNSKPSRTDKETWVAHAAPEWSEKHSTRSEASVISQMVQAFRAAVGVRIPEPEVATARYWTETVTVNPARHPYLLDSTRRVGVCGDWCLGPRVESAFQSGMKIAEHVLGGIESDRLG